MSIQAIAEKKGLSRAGMPRQRLPAGSDSPFITSDGKSSSAPRQRGVR